jgi:hypothetical protein
MLGVCVTKKVEEVAPLAGGCRSEPSKSRARMMSFLDLNDVDPLTRHLLDSLLKRLAMLILPYIGIVMITSEFGGVPEIESQSSLGEL